MIVGSIAKYQNASCVSDKDLVWTMSRISVVLKLEQSYLAALCFDQMDRSDHGSSMARLSIAQDQV